MKICLAKHYNFVMISETCRFNGRGSEASAVNEVDRPQLVVEASCGCPSARLPETLYGSKILRAAFCLNSTNAPHSPSAAVRFYLAEEEHSRMRRIMPLFHGRTPNQKCNALLANQAYLVAPPLQFFSPKGQRPQRMQIGRRFLLAITH
jgi:hypothetical protein